MFGVDYILWQIWYRYTIFQLFLLQVCCDSDGGRTNGSRFAIEAGSSISTFIYLHSQAFGDLQVKMVATRKQLMQNDMQCEFSRAVIKRCEITRRELEQLPADTPTYQTVGRM
jgi:hypothetical protein